MYKLTIEGIEGGGYLLLEKGGRVPVGGNAKSAIKHRWDDIVTHVRDRIVNEDGTVDEFIVVTDWQTLLSVNAEIAGAKLRGGMTALREATAELNELDTAPGTPSQ